MLIYQHNRNILPRIRKLFKHRLYRAITRLAIYHQKILLQPRPRIGVLVVRGGRGGDVLYTYTRGKTLAKVFSVLAGGFSSKGGQCVQ